MIRVERDPAFWREVATHPEVARVVGLPVGLDEVVTAESVIPLASEHGGFLFCRLDAGRVYELHTLFTPEGWGREVFMAGVEALNRFPWQVITTYEVEGNRRSRPPATFGFAPAGEFEPSAVGLAKTWVLTRAAWERSPARRRTCH